MIRIGYLSLLSPNTNSITYYLCQIKDQDIVLDSEEIKFIGSKQDQRNY